MKTSENNQLKIGVKKLGKSKKEIENNEEKVDFVEDVEKKEVEEGKEKTEL